MAILYKSSKFETYLYYIIYPILIGVSSYFIFSIFKYGEFSLFILFIMIVFVFVLVSSIDSIHKLKYIEVNDSSILVKTIFGEKIIKFENVEYAYNLININGNSLIVWYKDEKTQKSKVILARPDEKNPSTQEGFPIYSYGATELDITKFIKDKAIKLNQRYLNTNKPHWFLYGRK